MRVLRYTALGLLVVALIVTSVGWYRGAHSAGGSRFDSCTFDGTTLVLTWTYGVDSLVSPSVDVRSGRIVVGLRENQSSGAHIAVGLPERLGSRSVARAALWNMTTVPPLRVLLLPVSDSRGETHSPGR